MSTSTLQETKVVTQHALGVTGEGQAQVGVEAALVEFVEQHASHAGQGAHRDGVVCRLQIGSHAGGQQVELGTSLAGVGMPEFSEDVLG